MIFKRRDQGGDAEFVGEARFVDPSEDITAVRESAIDAVAEPEIVTATAVIGQSIVIRGDVSGDEDLVIEGRVEGSVALPKSRLTVGSNGDIAADVNAKTLNIQGQIKGDVDAIENVVLKSTGKMQGNIKAPRITLEDGCIFNGTINMESEPSAVITDLKKSGPAQAGGVKAGAEQQAV